MPSVYGTEEKNEQQRPADTAANNLGGPSRDGAPAPGEVHKQQCLHCWEEWLNVKEMLRGSKKGLKRTVGDLGMRLREGDCARNPKERGTCSVGLTGTTQ